METGRGTCKCGSRREGEANKEACNVLNHVCI